MGENDLLSMADFSDLENQHIEGKGNLK